MRIPYVFLFVTWDSTSQHADRPKQQLHTPHHTTLATAQFKLMKFCLTCWQLGTLLPSRHAAPVTAGDATIAYSCKRMNVMTVVHLLAGGTTLAKQVQHATPATARDATSAATWMTVMSVMTVLYLLAAGTTLASRHTAPATTGDATLVPDRLLQPPWMRLPITSLPYATTSGCKQQKII